MAITLTHECIREKNAKLTMRLATNSGMRSQVDGRVSALQWAAIQAIVDETMEGRSFMETMAARIIL